MPNRRSHASSRLGRTMRLPTSRCLDLHFRPETPPARSNMRCGRWIFARIRWSRCARWATSAPPRSTTRCSKHSNRSQPRTINRQFTAVSHLAPCSKRAAMPGKPSTISPRPTPRRTESLQVAPASPIFVVGVSRSGTTLTEQILAAHDDLAAAGERSDMPDLAIRIARSTALAESPAQLRHEIEQVAQKYLGAAGPGRLIDKQPVNFRLLALIGKAFPAARVVRMHRDPRDVCISNFASPIRPEMAFATSMDSIMDEIEDL